MQECCLQVSEIVRCGWYHFSGYNTEIFYTQAEVLEWTSRLSIDNNYLRMQGSHFPEKKISNF